MSAGEEREGELTPQEALLQIGQVDRRVRRPARVAGLFYAILGLATIVYWPVMFLGPEWTRLPAVALWSVMTIFSIWHFGRMGVQDREVTWANRGLGPVTIAYTVTVLIVCLFGFFLLPENPGPGWSAALITLSVCTSVPPFYAAWRVLRTTR